MTSRTTCSEAAKAKKFRKNVAFRFFVQKRRMCRLDDLTAFLALGNLQIPIHTHIYIYIYIWVCVAGAGGGGGTIGHGSKARTPREHPNPH